MASTVSAVTLTLGAALGAGWLSTMGKAKGDISGLGNAIQQTRAQQNSLGLPDLDKHQRNEETIAKTKKALDDYRNSLDAAKAPTEEQNAILDHLTKRHERAAKELKKTETAIKSHTIALKAEGKDVAALTTEYKRLGEQQVKLEALGSAWQKASPHLVSFGKFTARTIGITGAATLAAYKFVNATASEGEALKISSELRTLATKGEPQALADGYGRSLGHWVIQSITEDQSHHLFPAGAPRKQDFTIVIARYHAD